VYNQGHVYGAIYLDDGATNWTVKSNVVKKANAQQWLLYKGSNNHADGNYSDDERATNMTTGPLPSSVTNTVVVKDGNWPAAAAAIMEKAGPLKPAAPDLDAR
jgi:hypothetical protein